MNLNDIANQLIFTTVPIWTEKNDGKTEIGTGFIFSKIIDDVNSIPLMITNKHVVENTRSGTMALVKGNDGKPNNNERVTINVNGDLLQSNMHESLDIAVFPLGPALNQLKDHNINIFFKSTTKELLPNDETIENLSAIEEITFIGYPSGLYDRRNNAPITRRGITASPYWNNYDDEPVFLIDAGVYPGSSGSPVFIMNRGSYPTKNGIAVGNRILFLGMIMGTLIRSEKNQQNIYLGLGKVIKSKEIYSFVEERLKYIKQ